MGNRSSSRSSSGTVVARTIARASFYQRKHLSSLRTVSHCTACNARCDSHFQMTLKLPGSRGIGLAKSIMFKSVAVTSMMRRLIKVDRVQSCIYKHINDKDATVGDEEGCTSHAARLLQSKTAAMYSS